MRKSSTFCKDTINFNKLLNFCIFSESRAYCHNFSVESHKRTFILQLPRSSYKTMKIKRVWGV